MKICSLKNYPVIRQNHRISGYPAPSGYPDPVKFSGYPVDPDPVAKLTSGTTLVKTIKKIFVQMSEAFGELTQILNVRNM